MQTKVDIKLKLIDLLLINLSIIVGAGIFEIIPFVAKSLPTINSVILMWIFGGLISIFGAYTYDTLTKHIPLNGGDYIFLKTCFSARIADLYAWSRLIILQPASIAAMALLSSKFVILLITNFFILPTIFNTQLVSIIFIVALSITSIISPQKNLQILNSTSLIKIFFLLFVILIGFANLYRIPIQTLSYNPNYSYSFQALNSSLVLILFTYGGWSEIIFASRDVAAKSNSISKAIYFSIILITIVYALINYLLIKDRGYLSIVNSKDPVGDFLDGVLSNGSIIVNLIVAISCLGAAHSMIYTGSKLMPELNIALPRKAKTDLNVTHSYIFQMILSLVLVLYSENFHNAVLYTSSPVWFFFLLTSICPFILWKRLKIATSRMLLCLPFTICCLFLFINSLLYNFYQSLIIGVLLISSYFIYLLVTSGNN